MAERFQKLFDKNQYYLDQVVGKSKAWYFNEVDKLAAQRITPNRVLNDNANNAVSRIIPGNLYFYGYDPKFKETLPYYDRFPMVFPFSLTNNGFIGLNMHYLPYDARIKLFDALFTLKSSKMLTENTKLKLSWEAIQNLSRFPLAAPCVKRYLWSHIKTKIIKIESYHWTTAMFLPVERFVKSNKMGVWMDSTGR